MTKTLNEVGRNVELLLEKNPAFRNDDTELLLEYWRTCDDAEVDVQCNSKPLTAPASIIRRRQEIQAKRKLLPTNAKVRRKRGKPE